MTALRLFVVRSRHGFQRLTRLGYPPSFPIVQFPNLPLLISLAAAEARRFVGGSDNGYLTAVSYTALTVWAYEEMVDGANWFRHVLGTAVLIIVALRVAAAVRT